MTIVECAEYVVLRCERLRRPIANNQLNLLLYVFQLEMKRKFNKTIVGYASQRGPLPAFHACYEKFSSFGALPIQRHLSYEKEKTIKALTADSLSEEEMQFFDNFIDTYSDMPMSKLYELYEREKCFA